MDPTADARTDRMVYADCRRDCRITKTIYINNVALSSSINVGASAKKRPANCEPLYFYKQKCKERAFSTDVGRAIF